MKTDRCFGKYRGTVTENKDPFDMCRIKASVPSIFGKDESSGWALPSVPYAGKNVGLIFVPPVGANVWIEFEDGNIDSPIWSGCFWKKGELPETDLPNTKAIVTENITITLNDSTSDSLTITNKSGLHIDMDSTAIELKNGSSSIKISKSGITIKSTRINLN